MIEPKVGDFYIFPYDLEHLVYPFRVMVCEEV